MKKSKLISLILSATMLFSLVTVPAAASSVTFGDMDGHWSSGAVERWAEAGVFQGNEAGDFMPDKEMTRAEFATMLANLMGYTEKAENSYSDVKDDDWFADAVLKLTAAGVMQGDGANAMPNATISREQAAVMLCRALKLRPRENAGLEFEDSSSVSDWAREAVTALAERGMVSGTGGNRFSPSLDINRASAATMLHNMVSEYITEAGASVSGEQKGIVIVAADNVVIRDAKLSELLIVAPKAADATVTLTGKTEAADMTVSAQGVTVVVDKNARAEAITVESPKVTVRVSGRVNNVTVAETAGGTGVTVERGGSVSTLETAAADVRVDGSGKITTVTVTGGKGVEIATNVADTVNNQSDSTVKVGDRDIKPGASFGGASNKGSSGGSGNPAPAPAPTPALEKYIVSIGNFTGGKVEADVTKTDAAGTTVTLTVTPNAQDGNSLPYVLKADSLKVTRGETQVALTNGTQFTMDEPGTYVVSAQFIQPITKAGVLVVDGDTVKIADMTAYGYPENPEGAPVTDEKLVAAKAAYLFIGLERADKGAETQADITPTVTFNGTAITSPEPTLKNWACTYIDTVVADDTAGDNQNCTFHFTGSYAVIVVTFTYEGASYRFTADYTKPGVDESKLTTITFKNGEETVAQYKGMPAVEEEGGDTTAAETVTAPTAPVKTGYTFSGWKCGETSVNAEATASFAEENSVYEAQWTENSYTIHFDANGGTGSMNDMAGVRYTETKALTENTFEKTGHTFQGWATAQDGKVTYADGASVSKLSAVQNGTVTLYAVWKINKYTVTFNSNGGSAVASAEVEYDSLAAKPADPAKTGHKFVGWYKDAELTQAWDFESAKVTGALTLYANWVKACNVTFVGEDGSTVYAATVVEGDKAQEPEEGKIAIPDDKTGIAGYFEEQTFETAWDFENKTVSQDVTIYVKWSLPSTIEVSTNGFNHMNGDDRTIDYYYHRSTLSEATYGSGMAGSPGTWDRLVSYARTSQADKGISFSESKKPEKATEDHTITLKNRVGTLFYYDNFTGFSNSAEEQAGWYLPLYILIEDKYLEEGCDPSITVSMGSFTKTYGKEAMTKKVGTGSRTKNHFLTVIRITSAEDKYTFTFDWDGESGKDYTPTNYVLDLTGLSLTPVYTEYETHDDITVTNARVVDDPSKAFAFDVSGLDDDECTYLAADIYYALTDENLNKVNISSIINCAEQGYMPNGRDKLSYTLNGDAKNRDDTWTFSQSFSSVNNKLSTNHFEYGSNKTTFFGKSFEQPMSVTLPTGVAEDTPVFRALLISVKKNAEGADTEYTVTHYDLVDIPLSSSTEP